jgi:hypothetical protein
VCTGTNVACAGSCVDLSTDAHDCGACAHDCLGAACSGGQCAPRSVVTVSGVGLLAVDTTTLFLGANFDIDRVPLTGGTPMKINMPDGVIGLAPEAFVLDNGNVFWTSAGSPTTGYVVSVSKGGGGQRELVNQLASYGKPLPLAAQLDANGNALAIIWVSAGDGQSPDHPFVMTTSPSGSSQLIGVLPTLFANSVALDATSAYVTSEDGHDVYKVPLAGGTPAVFASGLTAPLHIVADAQNLYVLDLGAGVGNASPNGSIVAIPLAGGPPVTLAANLPNLEQIAVAGGYVYATSSYRTSAAASDGAVLAVPTAGGTPITLASGQPTPGAIAVDATYVYWATPTAVWRAPR